MEENFNKIKIAMILNYIVFLFTLIATIIMFTGIKFMHGTEPILESSFLGMFRFFTVDSNILIGIISLIMAIKERKLLIGKVKNISNGYYIMKLVGTVSVTLTFLVVFLYLGPLYKGGLISMLQNSNLFFHLIIPILSMLTFCCFEKTNIIKFRHTLYGIIPVFLYGVYYLINILTHIENNKVSSKYDWYWFVHGGLNQIYVIVPLMLLITFLISVMLWFLNKKDKKI